MFEAGKWFGLTWFYLKGIGDVPVNLCCCASLWPLQHPIVSNVIFLLQNEAFDFDCDAHHKVCLSFYQGGKVDDHDAVDHSHKRNNTGKSESYYKKVKVGVITRKLNWELLQESEIDNKSHKRITIVWKVNIMIILMCQIMVKKQGWTWTSWRGK